MGAPVSFHALNECFEWKGWRTTAGYGKFFLKNGKQIFTHRAAYAWANGLWSEDGPNIPTGLCVMHKCDNPSCCNPAHLVLGTKADNNADMTAKGRHWSSKKTHCKRGHAFSDENTFYDRHGGRECRKCRFDYFHARHMRRKAEKANAVY